jgi:hypothetical protein
MIESQFQIATNFNGQIRVEKRRRIPEGTYFCKIVAWKTMFMFGGHKLIIDCYLSEYEINISFICNIQISPDGTVKNPGRRSRLFKLLKKLNGRSQGNFDLNDLIGLACMAEVVTSKKDEQKMEKPEDEQYSVISDLELEPVNQDTVDDEDDIPF